MTIKVKSVNDAPIAQVTTGVVSEGQSTAVFNLEAVDVDDSEPSNVYTYDPSFSDTLFAKITAWPAFATLYQTDATGTSTEIIADSSGQLEASGSEWASEVVRFSSQW